MPTYITVMQSPMYHQISLEELIFEPDKEFIAFNQNTSNTRTYVVDNVSDVFSRRISINRMVRKLTEFNEKTEAMRVVPRENLYHTFYIPKHSGGLRRIDAPNEELMEALRELKGIFENDFKALYHTSAFAYVKHRCTIDAVKRHQSNDSKWFGKYDLSNFFGSTTLEFVIKQFSMIFPFSEVIKDENGKKQLETALELCFLNGGLPQGTPISPLITNIFMIPIDFELNKSLRNFNGQKFVYTRYADDFIISSRYTFDIHEVENLLINTLAKYDAPFSLNKRKTRYGSSSGSNWNLGVMLNKDNKITVGYQKKRQFKGMLTSYIMDRKNGTKWDLSDIQVMEGYRNYYRSIEKETIDNMVSRLGEKFNVDIISMIKEDLR